MLGHISLGNNFLHTRGEREDFPLLFLLCVSEVENAEVILQEIFMWILTSLLCGF